MSARSTRSWLRNGLVVVQVSVCVVLLIAAGLLVRSLQKVLRSNPGFESARLLSVGYSLELSNYNAQRAQLFQQQLMEKLAALPGVQSVCVDRNFGGRATMTVLNEPGSSPRTFDSTPYEHIPAHYLETIGTPVVAGRYFTEEEAHSKAPVVIVSESTARTVWPNESALGKTVRLDRRLRNGSSEMVLPMARVVGVARDNQRFRIGETPQLYFYRPDSVAGELDTALLVRTSGDAAQLKEQARKAAYELEPVLRLFVETVEESIAHDNKVQATRAASEGGSALGVLALLLAAIGIYGVMAWTVAQRTREIGIRMALGARGGNVLALVLRHGLKMILFGLALGLTASVAVTRLMSGLLFGLSPTDPFTFAGVTVLLIAIGLFACYIPARRATKVDPLIALRYE